MADQVTISTFLELRDNLSAGLQKVADSLSDITSRIPAAQAGIKSLAQQSETAAKRMRRTFDSEFTAASNAARRRAIDEEASLVQRLRTMVSHSDAQTRLASKTSTSLAREERHRSSAAIREFSRIQSANQRLNRHVLVGASSMTTALNMVMGTITAVFGYRAIKSVVNLGREFENLEFRIAGTIKAFNLAPSFGQAQLQGERVLGVLREMAARLPGEAEEYAGAFTTALPKIIASGMTDLTKAADFVSRYTAVAISNSVDAAQAGRDLMLMLSGRAGLQVKTFTVLSEKIGLTAKQFNGLTKEMRLQKVQEALRPFESMLDRVGEGFDAKFGAVKSQIQLILRLASKPLFAGLKSILTDIERYLVRNKDTIVATAQVVARDLVSGFEKAKEFLMKLPENLAQIWDYTKLIAGVWAGATLINGVAQLIRSYQELRAILFSINLLSAGMNATGAAGTAGTAAKTAAQGVGLRFMTGAASTATLAALAVLLYPKEGASEKELAFEEQFKEAMKSREELDKKYSDIVELLKAQRPSAPFDPTTIFDRPMVEIAEDEKDKFVELYEKLGAGLGAMSIERRQAVEKQRERLLDYAAALGILVPSDLAGPPNLGMAQAPTARAANVTNFYNNRFDIKQEFAEGFDPDRIAVAFANDLARVGEMKLQSAYVLTGAVP